MLFDYLFGHECSAQMQTHKIESGHNRNCLQMMCNFISFQYYKAMCGVVACMMHMFRTLSCAPCTAQAKRNEMEWKDRISWKCFRFESLFWIAFGCVNFANESWVREHFQFFNERAIRDDKAFHCAMCLSLTLSINHRHSSGFRLSAVGWLVFIHICLCILHAIHIFWMYSIN